MALELKKLVCRKRISFSTLRDSQLGLRQKPRKTEHPIFLNSEASTKAVRTLSDLVINSSPVVGPINDGMDLG